MTNPEIKLRSYHLVKEHEEKNNRKVRILERNGYDILSESHDKKDIRHIEVKSSRKPRPNFRTLEDKQYDALMTDEKFYLYLVTGVGSNNEKIRIFRKNDLKHCIKEEKKYTLKLSKLI